MLAARIGGHTWTLDRQVGSFGTIDDRTVALDWFRWRRLSAEALEGGLVVEQNWITVGVDGSDGGRAAARWAAHEARRTGAGLRLVHVFTDYVPMAAFSAPAYPFGSVEGRALAARVVREAAHTVKPIIEGHRIEQLVLRGSRRAGLLQAAAEADLMVLGDEPHPAHHRLITGSVIAPVVAHSPTPVVIVPANHRAEQGHEVVVAGVKAFAISPRLVRQALELAADRAAHLVLIHAWEYSGSEKDLAIEHVDLKGWEESAAKELRQVVDEVARDFPSVETEIRVVYGQPARVLAEASASAGLLAIARRPYGLPFGHLGSTGRAVLREARCPVIVLPPSVDQSPWTVTAMA